SLVPCLCPQEKNCKKTSKDIGASVKLSMAQEQSAMPKQMPVFVAESLLCL
ncbi:17613_t:CDS:1, partial [Cetraspora pellucida]